MSNKEIQRAASLYKRFHGKEPTRVDIVDVEAPNPEVALVVGHVHGISYITPAGEKFFHKFGKSRPLLAVSSDGKQAYILKGGYKFTDRGFIG